MRPNNFRNILLLVLRVAVLLGIGAFLLLIAIGKVLVILSYVLICFIILSDKSWLGLNRLDLLLIKVILVLIISSVVLDLFN